MKLQLFYTILVISLCTGLFPKEQAFTIERISNANIEEAQFNAADIIQQQKAIAATVRYATITALCTAVGLWAWRWHKAPHNDQNTDTRLTTLETKIQQRQPPAYNDVPVQQPVVAIRIDQQIGSFLGGVVRDVAYGVGSVMQYGVATILGLAALVPVQQVMTSVLRDINLLIFLEQYTHFKTHVLAVLESLDEYNAPHALTIERKVTLMLMLEHAGNSIMRDLEGVIGYLQALVSIMNSKTLTSFQLQETLLLERYCQTIHNIGDDMATILEKITTVVDYEESVALSKAIRDKAQRIFNDCQALADIEKAIVA